LFSNTGVEETGVVCGRQQIHSLFLMGETKDFVLEKGE
jgi:hypothetical protein